MCNKKSMKKSFVKAFGMLSIASFALCSFTTVGNGDAGLVCDGNVLVCDSVNAYDSVEQVPEFPGGMQEMFKYMAMNVKYPQVARDINAQGRVLVDFVVMADGSITNINGNVRKVTSKYSDVAAKADDADKNVLSEVVAVAMANGEELSDEAKAELHAAAMKALKIEAERVVRAMPKWIPGKQDGKAVNVRFTLPVVFRLQ